MSEPQMLGPDVSASPKHISQSQLFLTFASSVGCVDGWLKGVGEREREKEG
jgi:hypothetical protein